MTCGPGVITNRRIIITRTAHPPFPQLHPNFCYQPRNTPSKNARRPVRPSGPAHPAVRGAADHPRHRAVRHRRPPRHPHRGAPPHCEELHPGGPVPAAAGAHRARVHPGGLPAGLPVLRLGGGKSFCVVLGLPLFPLWFLCRWASATCMVSKVVVMDTIAPWLVPLRFTFLTAILPKAMMV